MMKGDYENLLSEVVASAQRRTASLEACLAAARKERRARRNVRLSLAAIVPLLVAGYVAWVNDEPKASVNAEVVRHALAGPQMIPGTQIEVIDDEKLLSLFPDRAAALVGTGERQRFLLLDEDGSNVELNIERSTSNFQ